MKLIFCGGASEVGASCVLVKIAGRNLVFDSGVRMGQNKDFLPDMRMIQEKVVLMQFLSVMPTWITLGAFLYSAMHSRMHVYT